MTTDYVSKFNVSMNMCFIIGAIIDQGEFMSFVSLFLFSMLGRAHVPIFAGLAPVAIKSLWIEKQIYVTRRMAQIWVLQPAQITGMTSEAGDRIIQNYLDSSRNYQPRHPSPT